MSQHIELSAAVAEHQVGQRLDQVLAEMFQDYSRSRLKEWILAGFVSINGKIVVKAREKMQFGDAIILNAEVDEEVRYEPQDIKLNIVYEDDDILVINKPAGLVVHPGAGNPDGTVLNALLFHYPDIIDVPRAGIVHRLDKDTTGLMVIAKTIPAQTHLVTALQARRITREYEAIVSGTMTAGGFVDEPIGRHPTKRTHMAVRPLGKAAKTHYRVAEKYRAHTLLRLRLESGRTHQIRVHMTHITHSIVGDPVYAGRPKPPGNATDTLIMALRGFGRQALHARMLKLEHPVTGEMMMWRAERPSDMNTLIHILREDTALNMIDDFIS
ncbi:23S rRNA pseudouridine(1911/1915/1917) synthase RluD [Moritella viscosa]|uniref:Pseudouridine synthase n=1 Tax=Moritella viscosa TaxID=80854 RepID=A0A090IGR6_9GAMM|nr:23S rRNA pseudouridine(1911/1915/1917) synthase RluD [Moritella viscosa]CED61815.1 ribosomal large subunit pseudouridine synthase D [Moritella viscosa]SGY90950.1 Pseudouridine synthase [Moritella viscosa]SGY95174.1 Pseudouridine synthase [Moritella viscosa]SGY95540.1 Pseudouridine synthase [Moritella viscosa]SGZ00080.1 Pseudouridine synthase [Moritella viscosa]